MRISAIQKFTLLDFPDKSACIVFTPGCNFRCGYCHNPEFVLPEMIQQIKESFISPEIFFNFLEKRKGKLEGVVVTGGEPTMMGDLLPFLRTIKKMGFCVKLDTNGNKPEVLEQALNERVVDYVAMDVKTSLGQYKTLVGNQASETALAKSIEILKRGSVAYEFRATLIQEIHTPQIVQAMAELLEGVQTLYLQSFRPGTTLNPIFQTFHPFSEEEMKSILGVFEQHVEHVSIRN